MYINYKLALSKELCPTKISLLQCIKQNKTEDLEEILSYYLNTDVLNDFHQLGLIEYVKPKKKSDTQFKLIRLSQKGVDLLDVITTPDLTEGDEKMYEYLCQMYLTEEGRKLGNRKAGMMYCAQFRQIVGLSLHQMFYLCELFVNNTTFTKILEYIFFVKKDFPYGKFKDNIDSSKLYQFYNDNKQEVEHYWAQKIKE